MKTGGGFAGRDHTPFPGLGKENSECPDRQTVVGQGGGGQMWEGRGDTIDTAGMAWEGQDGGLDQGGSAGGRRGAWIGDYILSVWLMGPANRLDVSVQKGGRG